MGNENIDQNDNLENLSEYDLDVTLDGDTFDVLSADTTFQLIYEKIENINDTLNKTIPTFNALVFVVIVSIFMKWVFTLFDKFDR